MTNNWKLRSFVSRYGGQERAKRGAPPPVGVGEPIVNSTMRSALRVKAFSKWIFNCLPVLKKLAVMLNFRKSS